MPVHGVQFMMPDQLSLRSEGHCRALKKGAYLG